MRTIRTTWMAVSMLVCTGGASVHAYDVTGLWAGKASCKGFADGRKVAFKLDIAAGLSQSGRDVNVEFTGLSFVSRTSAIAIPDAKKPDKGEIGFVSCGTEPEPIFGVTGRGKVTTATGKTKATIKFVTVVAGKDIGDLGVADAAFTCTGTLKRTQLTDPGIGDCTTM